MMPLSESCVPLVALDLDGTLVSGNTLHIYIRCGLRQMMRRRRIARLGRSLALLAARKAGLVSHVDMKFGIFGLIERDERLCREFAEAVNGRLNGKVKDMVDGYASAGCRVLLATAAPAQYVPLIWKGDFVATDMDVSRNPARTECRGEEKLKRVLEYASSNGLRLHAAISDDAVDDAPLLAAAEESVLVKKGC